MPSALIVGACRATRLSAIALCLTIAATPLKASELRGLTIGIDNYPALGPAAKLEGAVADAQDIAQALRAAGSRDVTVLTDQAATRAAIMETWQKLVDRSRPGDVIVFSYAGHGSQEPEPAGRRDEADGKNENFILSGFDQRQNVRERIVDDEMFAMLKQADDRDIEVVLVADSCHSGTMYRSVANPVTVRKLELPEIAPADLALPLPATIIHEAPSAFKHVTFVAGTEDGRVVPEVPINGKKRGALSFSFARAIEGEADRDGDGKTTQAELVGFLVPRVTEPAQGQQSPQVLPVRATAEAIVPGRRAGTPASANVTDDALRLSVAGADSATLGGIPGVILTEQSSADVVFNAEKGTVDHVVGGTVAEKLDKTTVGPVIAKFAAIKWLTSHATGAPAQFTLRSGPQRYGVGETIDLALGGFERPFVTLFNLAPDGRVELLVSDKEAEEKWIGKTASWQLRPDKPPFGAEHLFAIVTDQPLKDLHGKLKAMSTADRAFALRQTLADALQSTKFQLGTISIYTGADK